MRVESIESLARLTDDQTELLQDVLLDHPEVNRAALVLYRLLRADGREVAMVAPASSQLRSGVNVICAGWTVSVQQANSGGDDVAELQVSESIVPE